jgi:tetratricopeptide (TPR) repeat protein
MKTCANPLRLGLAISVAGVLLSVSIAPPAHAVSASQPETSAADMSKAVTLMGQGKMKEADAVFQMLLEKDPRQLDAALGRAQIALTAHQIDRADQMVTAVLKRNDNLPEAHNMKGVVLLLRKNNNDARNEFARAIQLQPRYVTPYLYLAIMARQSGDFAGAAAQYKSVTQIAPHLPTGYLGEAEALTMQHREPDALNVLNSWKSADPSTLLPYKVIAEVDLSDHKPKDAVHELKAALAKSPHDSGALALLGDAYCALGDIPAAATQYDAAIAANHANSSAAASLGELEAAAGQNDRALLHFRMALEADPNNALAANDAAWLLADQNKNLDEALRLAQLAVKVSPRYADAYDTLGWVQYRQGKYVAAVATLKRAETLNPSSPDVAAHLGLAYSKSGHKQEALSELNRALKPGSTVSNRPELERVVAQLSAK